MDADLYDEFGNYIGPELEDSDDELADEGSEGSADQDAVDDDINDAEVFSYLSIDNLLSNQYGGQHLQFGL